MTAELLDRLEAAIAPGDAGERASFAANPAARARAVAVAASAGDGREAAAAAGSIYAGALLASVALEREWSRDELGVVLRTLASHGRRRLDLVAIELYRNMLDALEAEGGPPRLVIEAALRLLPAFAPVQEVGLWTDEPGKQLRCSAFVGNLGPTRRMRATARDVLGGDTERGGDRGFVHGVPVLRWGMPYGALVLRARPPDHERALVFAREAARTSAGALERAFLVERSVAREQRVVSASERRLSRLGFDIHDGPIQDVAALAGDLRLFRTQLRQSFPAQHPADLLVGRVDDFEARLVALDRELRELAHSLERTSALERPFSEALRSQVAAFTTRNDVTVKLDLRGDVTRLSASQRLALLAFVREALVNVRDHSGARSAAITITVGRTHTQGVVVDDGRGFEVERTLVQAARRGRLGLVGMSERLRMLGGNLAVESRPGGPTRVAVTVPRWDDVAAPAGAVGAA